MAPGRLTHDRWPGGPAAGTRPPLVLLCLPLPLHQTISRASQPPGMSPPPRHISEAWLQPHLPCSSPQQLLTARHFPNPRLGAPGSGGPWPPPHLSSTPAFYPRAKQGHLISSASGFTSWVILSVHQRSILCPQKTPFLTGVDTVGTDIRPRATKNPGWRLSAVGCACEQVSSCASEASSSCQDQFLKPSEPCGLPAQRPFPLISCRQDQPMTFPEFHRADVNSF